jgi:hypothetical protein
MNVWKKKIPKAFYQESEWRFLATHDKVPGHLSTKDLNDAIKLDDANSSAAVYWALNFTPQDVKYLFVKNESEIADLVGFINKTLNSHSQKNVQTLLT